MSQYDLVIRSGSVIDGTGQQPFTADVAIKNGKIAATGRVSGHGDREVNADGALVTPGFVDIHTHYDGQATWSNRMSPSSHHGVTSVVMGNCGVGFAPVRPTTTICSSNSWKESRTYQVWRLVRGSAGSGSLSQTTWIIYQNANSTWIFVHNCPTPQCVSM